MTKHIELDALQALADEFDTFLNEPPAYEQERMVRDYRHAAYPKWAKVESGMRTLIARIRELEGDTGKSAEAWISVDKQPAPPGETVRLKTRGGNELEGWRTVDNDYWIPELKSWIGGDGFMVTHWRSISAGRAAPEGGKP